MAARRRKASGGTSRSGVGANEALTPDTLRAQRAQLAKQHDTLMTEIAKANEQIVLIRGAIGMLDQLLTEPADARPK